MNKKIKWVLFVVSISASIGTTYFTVKDGIESHNQFEKDMQLLDKETELDDEYWSLYDEYEDGKISKSDYTLKLKTLYEKLDSLLEEGYQNKWDNSSDGSYFFQLIDLKIESIKNKLNELK